jgi:hypothetical protein
MRLIRQDFTLKHALTVTVCVVVLALAGWQIKGSFTASKIISPAAQSVNSGSSLQPQAQQVEQPKNSEPVKVADRTGSIADLPDDKINMQAYFAKYLDCQDENIQHKVSKKGSAFLATKLVNLCQLSLETPDSVTAILLISADSGAVLQLLKKNEQWQIPLPKKQSANRSYYLLLMSDPSAHIAKDLKAHLMRQTLPGLIEVSEIQQWLKHHKRQAKIVTHSLRSY